MQEVVATAVLFTLIGVILGFWVGYRRGQRKGARWLVRPHTPRTLARTPAPGTTKATVVEAAFGRYTLPNSEADFR